MSAISIFIDFAFSVNSGEAVETSDGKTDGWYALLQ